NDHRSPSRTPSTSHQLRWHKPHKPCSGFGVKALRIGELIGQICDLRAEWTEEAIQRITAENTNLKQRVRQLTTDTRTLDERLKAARSNLRFQDRHVADLEARIADPGPAT
ncbi:hypothetical protein PV334_26695, partial [Streptomyces sp. ME02-7008A-1]|nr:hypothetical protein [Streptomyces sp. ME02-7008A-1]